MNKKGNVLAIFFDITGYFEISVFEILRADCRLAPFSHKGRIFVTKIPIF